MSPQDILPRVPLTEHPYRFPVEITWDEKPEKFNLTPDFPVFGLSQGNTATFFIWETDCDTENNSNVKSLANASILKKILGYKHLMEPDQKGDNKFWHRLRITNNYVLIVTINETRKRAIIETVKRVFGKTPDVLIKTIPHFRRTEEAPMPFDDYWYTPWERVGYPPVKLSELEE